jgi:glycosyltransferase involved in cell wall biosynthesis
MMAPVRVSIVHDYLNQLGGAERVVLEMARIWPDAPIHTTLYRPATTWPGFAGRDIRTSALDRLPVDGAFRTLLPLFPLAIRSLGVLGGDLVVSSSSGWAHGVRTAPGTTHVVYCYAPARWLYGDRYIGWVKPVALAPLFAALRGWDRRAAQRQDAYITIAENVRRRVRDAYGIESQVVHPPVDVDRFRATPRGDRLLVVSRMIAYKRVDLAIRAAAMTGAHLDVVGDGPALDALRAIAGPTVTFHGQVDDAARDELLQACSAVVVAGMEDFGMVAVEANAAGKPVVAYAAGGALETQEEDVTGVFFREKSPAALADALRRVDRLDAPPDRLRRNALRFGAEAFRDNLAAAVDRVLERRQGPGRFARQPVGGALDPATR